MKDQVKVAYWDTAQGNPPRLFGQIRGTPTIKFVVPSKKNKRTTNKKKSISDYNGEREVGPMVQYAKNLMPSHLMKLKSEDDLAEFITKADKYALPKFLLFTKAKATQALSKALSTEFRRRALFATMKLKKDNMALLKKYGVSTKENNVLMVLPDDEDAEPIKFLDGKTGKKYDWKRASKFFKEHALEKPYFEDEVAQAKIAARDGAKAEL